MRLPPRSFLLSLLVLALLGASASAAHADDLIVVLKDGADSRAVAAEHRVRHDAEVRHVYTHALNGYAARVPGSELGALRADGVIG